MFKRILPHLSIALALFVLFPQDSQSQTTEKTILVMGDSLSAGYRLPHGASFPSRLEMWFKNNDENIKVINAGVSGDTSAGGLARLDWALSGLDTKPDLVIVEFGGNDALRGIDPENTKENLGQILIQLNEKAIPAYLMGMQAFFLEGVAAIPELNLNDGMHPNEAGINIIVENIAPLILALIE